ncbi:MULTISPECIES: hypothetical protein [unclassified Streptomyces]|uniref:hypothetical protein n=1 Tax=unclassified Streptomyces TaxID=2593676 RepID=UPI0013707568|nr:MULTISPECIES: hypothetical protein [unclassified Streptomyces]NEA03701.1 hypothetical protein [Streptomyces sp. SID10116]MYY79693.1 hypothetical protein [Streptomyces sp. SID335]MYZ12833.1 hypothetical protein [Streptomyces sp. SID337]NDZ91137.1 hypothetical protein [Streptomyces sp. SID10115]NEB43534.1 hypothetical protein [Streptomyces sp. SID339]
MLTRARHIGRHRGKTPAQLRAELDEAICIGLDQQTLIDELTAERTRLEAQLDAAGIELSGAREDLRAARKQIRHIEAIVMLRDRKIDDLQRKIDVGVKAEHVIAATQPVPVLPLHASPQAAVTNPGTVRRTSWGRDAEGVAG